MSRISENEISNRMKGLDGWEVVESHHLKKTFTFGDFLQTLEFVNRVAQAAEALEHHPDICFGWGRAEITTYTHSVDGLTERDFALASSIEEIGS